MLHRLAHENAATGCTQSTYTGVYAKGGPTNVDKDRASPGGMLSTLCDRSPADVRGVKHFYRTVL